MTFYTREVQMPKTKREGLENFVQMIVNKIEAGKTENALLSAVDLLNDIRSGIYDDAMADTFGHNEMARELTSKHQGELIKASQESYERGVSDEKHRMSKALGLAA